MMGSLLLDRERKSGGLGRRGSSNTFIKLLEIVPCERICPVTGGEQTTEKWKLKSLLQKDFKSKIATKSVSK
jgi:hypothetical protein